MITLLYALAGFIMAFIIGVLMDLASRKKDKLKTNQNENQIIKKA